MLAKRFFYVGLFLVGLTIANSALAQVELLPMGATYRYLRSPNGANPPGAESPGFDDSAFSTGPAPFGFGPNSTSWVLFEMLTARRHLYLSGAPTGAVLRVMFNGYGSLYINGELVCLLENCGPINGQVIPLCDGLLQTGDNVFVAVLFANCGGAYFDASINAAGGPTPVQQSTLGSVKARYR